MPCLFAHLFNGRGVPLTAQREAVSDGLESADGDCFPHILLFTPPTFAKAVADQPSCATSFADDVTGPASSDFVCPFHAQACAPAGVGRSAGKVARLTRLREGASALVRGRARSTRFVPDDVQ